MRIDRSCSVCGEVVKAKGLCDRHYRRQLRRGTTEAVRRQDTRKCSWDGCENPVRACGYCQRHYKIARRQGTLHPGKFKRDHPLYNIWWQHLKAGALCQLWENFDNFLKDVGERPDKNYTFLRLREGQFAPDNFEWKKHLTRESGESLKAWHARKWQARKVASPGWDNNRRLKRVYGITRAQYKELLEAQNGVCAICSKPETKISHRSRQIKNLAVDHCHKTKKVRGLLCSSCNVSIGQLSESIDTLRAMQAYLQHHSGAHTGGYICWHGTNEKAAKKIWSQGFRPHTHFASNLEDALSMGGPIVFHVKFDRPAPNWQFLNPKTIPPDRIAGVTEFWSQTLHGDVLFGKTDSHLIEEKSNE